MKASLRSVRISPKKASLVAKMVRGMSVGDAINSLEHTNKKAARILEDLVRSAVANAQHNDSQDAQSLVIKSLIVNKAQAYHRGVPMARGRVRPMRKFLSHIELTLGIADEIGEAGGSEGKKGKKESEGSTAKKDGKVKKATSQKPKNTVQKKQSSAKKADVSTEKGSSQKKTSSSSEVSPAS